MEKIYWLEHISHQTDQQMVKNLLVIDAGYTNWYKLFKGAKTDDGEDIKIEQAGWNHISLTSCSERGCFVRLAPVIDGDLIQQKDERELKVDFLLIRNFSGGLHQVNMKNIILGFMFSNIPSVNSLHSLFLREKPIVYGQLKQISEKLGKENFPVVRFNIFNIDTTNV